MFNETSTLLIRIIFALEFDMEAIQWDALWSHSRVAWLFSWFCMYICDDDFLLNSTLKCVEFLNENPDYTSVGGRALMLDVNDSWKIQSISESLSSLDESSPIDD